VLKWCIFAKQTYQKKQIGISLQIARVMFTDDKKVYTPPVLNTKEKKSEKNTKN